VTAAARALAVAALSFGLSLGCGSSTPMHPDASTGGAGGGDAGHGGAGGAGGRSDGRGGDGAGRGGSNGRGGAGGAAGMAGTSGGGGGNVAGTGGNNSGRGGAAGGNGGSNRGGGAGGGNGGNGGSNGRGGAGGTNCACPQIYMPVCGVDGMTYGNSCEADCNNVAVAHQGACLDECVSNADCIQYADGIGGCCGACLPKTAPMPAMIQCLRPCDMPTTCPCVLGRCVAMPVR